MQFQFRKILNLYALRFVEKAVHNAQQNFRNTT